MGKTNRLSAKENKEFREDCEAAGCEPTKRQFSKWKNKKGSAWQCHFKPSSSGAKHQ